MRIRHTLLIVLVVLLLPSSLLAQRFEAGIFLGGTSYMGDLAPVAFNIKEVHPAIGGLVRWNANRFISFKIGLTMGTISGTDDNSREEIINIRNLSFRSRIWEASLQAEYNILGHLVNNKGFRFSPYITAGIGIYRFNPQAQYLGEWIDLQPLGTEGQGIAGFEDREYTLTQMSIPFGAGLKYRVTRFMNLGIEVTLHKTFTDYLDDVSTTYVDQSVLSEASGDLAATLADRSPEVIGYNNFPAGEIRGDPTDKDWYIFGGLTLTFSLYGNDGANKGGGKKKGGGKSGCYTF